ncbi:MAG: hypothetical protein Q9168_006479, partial [Polycauliona sp. 1 TL-2023]
MSPHAVALAESVGQEPQEPIPHLWTRLTDHAVNNGNSPAVKSLYQPVAVDGEANTKPTTEVSSWTYHELHQKATTLAAHLFDLSVRKGDAIAVFLDNQAEWVLLYWASIRLDAVFVPLNPRVMKSKEEVNHILRVTKPRVVVVADSNAAKELQVVATKLTASVPIKMVVDSNDNSLNNGWTSIDTSTATLTHAKDVANVVEQRNMLDPINDLDQIMVVIFTSGTTSLPKASVSTHGNVLAGASGYKALRHLKPDAVLLGHLPAFHSWSICVSWSFWLTGACVVYPSKTFDARSSLSAIERAHCTLMPAVPSMVQALVAHPSLSGINLNSLQTIDLAGTMILPEIIEACMDILKAPYTSVAYGMTEGSAVCASDMYDIPYARHNIPKVIPCGKALPGARLRVCKPGSRELLRRGEKGELHMGGPQVTKGYMDRLSDDFYNLDGINWVVTGDQACIDDRGLVYILGRYKDLIIRGGENISPAMIEQCLDSIEGIKDSQVVGLPDEIAGEVPVAVVRKSSTLDLTDYQIQQKISGELGMMFAPTHILELQHLDLVDYPRTTSGKIKKGDLKHRVGQYLYTKDEKRKHDPNASTVDTLIRFWARLSGREANHISQEEHADTFADSIMMMQFCNLVGKDLSKTIAVDEIVGDVSITKQAQIIDGRPAIERLNKSVSRSGPPTEADMVHVNGNPEAATQCQQKVKSLLRPYGFGWDDVEDIMPTGQTVALMTRRTRLRNWNRRHAYHVPNATTADLHWAVTTCLELHPTYRSMILDHGEAQPLYVVLRSCDRLHQLAISGGHTVEKVEDLKTLYFDSDSIDFATTPGPLFKFLLVDVSSTKGAGLIILCHHSTFDALAMGLLFEDLDTALRTRRTPKTHASFKEFADRKFRYIESPNADAAVAFHVDRLQGYQRHRNAFWPPQRAPQFFRGSDSQWLHVDGTPGKPAERRILEPGNAQGAVGINGSITLSALPHLKTTYGITANIVFKAALALLNIHHTGATQAFFGATEAARVWPTNQGDPDPNLPNTMDIPGPAWETIINRIHINRSQPLLSWLQDLQSEQALITKYAAAPIRRIQEGLRETTTTTNDDDDGSGTNYMGEHELYDSIIRRENFN